MRRARASLHAATCAGALAGAAAGGLGLAAWALPPDRGDLGIAYLRFERAVASAARDPSTRREANLAFDALTGDFFAGRYDRALVRLAAIEGDLARESLAEPTRAERSYLASHRFEIEPRIADASSALGFTVRALALDGMPGGAAPSQVVLRQGGREVAVEGARIAGQGATVDVEPPFAPGVVEVVLRMHALGEVAVGRAFLFDGDPVARGRRLAERIDALAGDGRVDPSTLASLRARHELAFGTFRRARSADLLANPIELAERLDAEIAQASAGGRPYAARGDLWRVVRTFGAELPVRQFVPEGDGPFPLIVAFHGAGGDENMLFDGYGGGRLLAIARERGIAVVCPPTVPFGLSPNVLVRFLEELGRDVPFDPARVGLLGHSLGAATASRLAVLAPDCVNGAACIAGFADLARKVDAPPRRIYLAELDPIFPLGATRASVDAARARGEAVEFVEVPHEGHTLVVGEVLDQAVDWLLARAPRTRASAPPTASAPSTAPMKTDGPPPAAPTTSPIPGPTK